MSRRKINIFKNGKLEDVWEVKGFIDIISGKEYGADEKHFDGVSLDYIQPIFKDKGEE